MRSIEIIDISCRNLLIDMVCILSIRARTIHFLKMDEQFANFDCNQAFTSYISFPLNKKYLLYYFI